MIDYRETLGQTVRVLVDGTVVRGIEVPHTGANVKAGVRMVAAVPRSARASLYRVNEGIPKGVDQTITLPHDCDNHLE